MKRKSIGSADTALPQFAVGRHERAGLEGDSCRLRIPGLNESTSRTRTIGRVRSVRDVEARGSQAALGAGAGGIDVFITHGPPQGKGFRRTAASES